MASDIAPTLQRVQQQPASSTGAPLRHRIVARFGRLPGALIHEPLLHFVAAGLVIFLIGHSHRDRADYHRIAITSARQTRLANQYALQFGTPPDASTLERLIESDVHDEILFREALALQLDKDDEIIRRRMVQKMQFLLEDLRPPDDPTDAQLHSYYRVHLDRYMVPPRVTFSHVYFSAAGGESVTRDRALATLRTLTNRTRAPGAGDPFPDLYDFAGYAPEQVERLFGASEFSRAVFSTPPGHWAGPFKSTYGWHLLYVELHQPGEVRPFTAVRDKVHAAYLQDEQGRTNDVAFRQLANQFTVVRDVRGTSP